MPAIVSRNARLTGYLADTKLDPARSAQTLQRGIEGCVKNDLRRCQQMGSYPGKEENHVRQAFQPDLAARSGWSVSGCHASDKRGVAPGTLRRRASAQPSGRRPSPAGDRLILPRSPGLTIGEHSGSSGKSGVFAVTLPINWNVWIPQSLTVAGTIPMSAIVSSEAAEVATRSSMLPLASNLIRNAY